MSRRKHVTQASLEQDVQAPAEGECIVRALGSRGGNIIEIQHPDGSQGLALIPARFHKKLWVRRGGFLVVEHSLEAAADAGSRVTGTIKAVLYEEHIRLLRKMPGVWPKEFEEQVGDGCSSSAGGHQQQRGQDEQQQCGEAEGGEISEVSAALQRLQVGTAPQVVQQAPNADAGAAGSGGPGQGRGEEGPGSESEESDDDLPPVPANNNRRIIYHEISSSEDEEEG